MRALSADPRGVSMAGIAAEVGLPRSTVQRIATALVTESLAEPAGAAGGVRLGPALGLPIYPTEADLVSVARPHLKSPSQALLGSAQRPVASRFFGSWRRLCVGWLARCRASVPKADLQSLRACAQVWCNAKKPCLIARAWI